MLDIVPSEFRASIDNELASLLATVRPRKPGEREIYGIRQFLGWHRLCYREELPLDDVPQRLARFIVDRSVAESPGESHSGEILQAMIAADLLRETRSFTVDTLRRRVAALSLIFGPGKLREHPALQQALATARDAERQSRSRRMLAGCSLPEFMRARLLGTCDASSVGVRDRALLEAWFATGASLPMLTRSDEQALVHAIGNCPDAAARAAAAAALREWCSRAQLPPGPVFRRIWGSDRIGAPMSAEAANRMLRRRLALAAARPVAES